MVRGIPVNETDAQREARWQREEDARTLSRAAEISGDPKRAKAAQSEIKKQLKELDDRKRAMASLLPTPTKRTQTKPASKAAPKGAKRK